MDKKELRRIIIKKRLSLTDSQRAIGEKGLLNNLAKFLQKSEPDIALFVAIRGEPDILRFLKNPLLPCIEGNLLVFRRFLGEFVVGRYGILEPPPYAPIVIPKIICSPLVAFCRNGDRLGYGAGYYDRTFRDFEGKKIGIAWSFQEVKETFAEPHDMRLDWIITESEVIRCF